MKCQKIQIRYPWVQRFSLDKKYSTPWGESYFNYDRELRDLLGDIIPYIVVCKFDKIGVWNWRMEEENLQDIYCNAIAISYQKVINGLVHWNMSHDIFAFAVYETNWGITEALSMYNDDKEVQGTLTSLNDVEAFLSNDIHGNVEYSDEILKWYDDNKVEETEIVIEGKEEPKKISRKLLKAYKANGVHYKSKMPSDNSKQ